MSCLPASGCRAEERRDSEAVTANVPKIADNRPAAKQPAFWDRLSKRMLQRRLAGLECGALTLVDSDGRTAFGQLSNAEQPSPTLYVNDPRFFGDVALGGSIGAGESYMRGRWTSDDLTSLVRLLIVNRSVLEDVESVSGWWRGPARRLVHFLRSNTRQGSQQNIAAHYDLGNDFFAQFLDETMMYSCGVFERPESTMLEASTAKNERICRKLALTPRDHLLEIGTGWGGFAIHAARNYGCRVTTTTISQQQYHAAVERVRLAGLASQVEVLLHDYRDLTGRYDKLVSIEMIEAVGERFLPDYFAACSRLLQPQGTMLLQAITICDQQFDAYRKSVDFIQRHVFPGGFLPSLGALCRAIGQASDLRVDAVDDMAAHYARTLRAWRTRFTANLDVIRGLGYSETLLRMWDFYLCYCEAAFLERSTGCAQLVLSKPGTTSGSASA